MAVAPQPNAPITAVNEVGDRIDPARAVSGLSRWRRAVSDALGQDPGAALDQPDRRLLMLRIFGTTRRLAELCMTFPAAAASSVTGEPSSVIAEAARDLAGLERGVGGPQALHAALSPVKARADIAIAIAELSGQWSVADATAARVDFAERIVETALRWLTRAAVKRGELAVADADHFINGVFVLAGGDFAHEDLVPYGPLDLIVLYDDETFAGPAQRGADRVFVRIGAEIREALEGKPGEYPLFALRTPLGSGVGGAGYAASTANVSSQMEGADAQLLRIWLATARVVAGDRHAGGEYLEAIEPVVWGDAPMLTDDFRDALEKESDDPRAVFRGVAELCRLAVGGGRPLFRTASAREIFESAARSQAIAQDASRRLIAGEELAHLVVSRIQMIKGSPAAAVTRDDERQALATLCGFSDYETLSAALTGVRCDARNTLTVLARGPQAEIAKYRTAEDDDSDAGKLEDLGFLNGASLSVAVDEWARRAGADDQRFASYAPGFLTAIGETQSPENAVRLFDSLLANASENADPLSFVKEGAPRRGALVDMLGCFHPVTKGMVETDDGSDILLDPLPDEAPASAQEWLARFPGPATGEASVEDIARWRRQTIGRVAGGLANHELSFDLAAAALDTVHRHALTAVFDSTRRNAKGGSAAAADHLSMHVFDGAGLSIPGAPSLIGFVAADGHEEPANELAREYLDALDVFGEGVFAVNPDISHRPGGVVGPIAASVKEMRSFIQSEAIAQDQILLARARVIAGAEDVANDAAEALRGAVSGARRADVLFRDLDRARAQRLRRERPTSDWDIDRLDGGRCDAELIISTLIYRHAPAHPFVQELPAGEALDAMARSDLLASDAAKTLKYARAFWSRLQLIRSLAQWSDPIAAPVRPRFARMIARAAGVERFEEVRPLMRGYADDVNRLYAQLVLGRPSLNLVAQAAG